MKNPIKLTHPDTGGEFTVPRASYVKIWAGRGWVPVSDDPVVDEPEDEGEEAPLDLSEDDLSFEEP